MKRNLMKSLALAGLAALLIQPALQGKIRKGTWEVGLAGSYSSLDAGGSDIDLAQINLKFGYFVTGVVQTSGMLTYLDADLDGDSLKATMLGGALDFYMGSTEIQPYIGASAYWVDVELEGLGSADDMAWDAHAGIKQFVAENVAIDYRVSYIVFDDLDLDGFSVGVGLSYLF